MMFQVELGSDDFYKDKDSDFVKIGAVVSAIARILLSNGSANRFQAERDAWPYIHTGIAAEKLHPLAPNTLRLLSINDYGNGILPFDELVEWGRWTKRFDFVVASPAAKVEADKGTAAKTNKLIWDDAMLRALYEESILPGVTQQGLAKKHKVSRQRIGTLLNQAKEKFGLGKPSQYSQLMAPNQIHKGNKY